jgi:hypothetical protein
MQPRHPTPPGNRYAPALGARASVLLRQAILESLVLSVTGHFRSHG